MSTPEGAIIIVDKIMELEHEAHNSMLLAKRLMALHTLGYRYVDEDMEPHMGHDNVVNIAKDLIP